MSCICPCQPEVYRHISTVPRSCHFLSMCVKGIKCGPFVIGHHHHHHHLVPASPPPQDFDTFLKVNSMKLADGRSQCRLCDKITTHIGNMRQGSPAYFFFRILKIFHFEVLVPLCHIRYRYLYVPIDTLTNFELFKNYRIV